jgi:hypothetical protein
LLKDFCNKEVSPGYCPEKWRPQKNNIRPTTMVFKSNGSQADDAAAAAARESVQHAAAAPAASHIGVPMSPLSEVLWRGKGFMKPSNEGHKNTYGEVLGAAAMLTWKDLCVTVVGGGQTILQSISGTHQQLQASGASCNLLLLLLLFSQVFFLVLL